MRYALGSGLPVKVSDDGQLTTPGPSRVRAKEHHMTRLALRRLAWWPSWSWALGALSTELRWDRAWLAMDAERSAEQPKHYYAMGTAVISD